MPRRKKLDLIKRSHLKWIDLKLNGSLSGADKMSCMRPCNGIEFSITYEDGNGFFQEGWIWRFFCTKVNIEYIPYQEYQIDANILRDHFEDGMPTMATAKKRANAWFGEHFANIISGALV